jgi:exodeoxyribonuclease V alpha subunit
MLSIKKLLKIGYKINDIQVLSVMNKGDLGVEELNRKIQKIFNPHNPQKQEIELNQKILRVNDKVMQTENDYDLGVFNGEVGNIVSINRLKHEVKVNFGDNKEILYNNENFCELTLAYAATVHKSQGCEFDVIIMPFHRSLNILLNRNIIYTGITRAKKRVVCIGDMDELMDGIDRTENVIRNSRIKERLEKIVLQSSYSVM